MQRQVIVDMSEQAAARSLSTLHPVERLLAEGAVELTPGERLQLALVQQLEGVRLAIMALVAPEDS